MFWLQCISQKLCSPDKLYCKYVGFHVDVVRCCLLSARRHCQSVTPSVLHVIQRQKSFGRSAESAGT